MPKNIDSTQELERELSILHSGSDSHQAGNAGVVRVQDPYFEPAKPAPPSPPPPKPDDKPKLNATLRHP